MKTTLCITLILLTFLTLTFVPNSFAQVISIPDERVRWGICDALEALPDVNDLDCDSITAQDMEKLTELELIVRRPEDYHDYNYNNIIGLEYAINLERFEIHRTFISDITPLTGLTKLTWLKMVSNEVDDISPLAGLTNLEFLRVEDNNVRDVTPLSRLTQLTTLAISYNQITDISPIAGLTNLTDLDVGGNQITDFSPIAGLTNLEDLRLDESGITDTELNHIAGLTNLEFLSLSDNQITDIGFLSALTNLQFLRLSENQITDISPIAGLTNLTRLILNGNQIGDVSPLTALTNLQSLEIYDNPIEDIQPLLTLLEKNPNITIYLKDFNTVLTAENAHEYEVFVPTPTRLEIVSGNAQSALINQPLTNPLVVRVKDQNGNPMTGASVSFLVNPSDGQLTRASSTTDENGEAQTSLTLGNTIGTYTTTASVSGVTNVTFTATANRPQSQIRSISNNQIADINQPLPYPLVVKIMDKEGNPVAGVPVTFSVHPSDGILDTISSTTDENGEAQTSLTLGNAIGRYTVTASFTGVSGTIETAIFTATAYVSPIPKVVVSEIMFETKGEIEKYPQWIELYNHGTSDVNLNGWKIILLDRSFTIDSDFVIKPNSTALIVSHPARFSENIVWDNIWRIDQTIIDESTLNEFMIRLIDNEDREIDDVSNLDLDDHTRWDMLNCIVPNENDARTSIIRRFREGEPVQGYKRIAWIRAYNTKSIINSDRWYGHKTDIGTPVYRSARDPLPVQLSLFTAKFDGDKVGIEWITESEIDNAGFNIYRSETRNGQFKQVNAGLIHGAGTTGERNTYTWTDTTAKPNVEYYYRIEDVSHAGNRQTLATARTKGIISAKDRFITQWGKLKR